MLGYLAPVCIDSTPLFGTSMGTIKSSTSIIVPLRWGVLLRRVPCYNLAKEQVR